jgi:hypothetical protein
MMLGSPVEVDVRDIDDLTKKELSSFGPAQTSVSQQFVLLCASFCLLCAQVWCSVPPTVNEDMLMEHFSKAGEVSLVRIKVVRVNASKWLLT